MSFLDSCQEIAQRFVSTVVVVDDQAFRPAPIIAPAQAAPPARRGFVQPEEDVPAPGPPGTPVDDERPAHGLDAGMLSRRFAGLGIVCAAYAPVKGDADGSMVEADADNTAKLARSADIVIVDWLLDGRKSSMAIRLIRSILDADRDEGGRLRLIAVYTGEGQLPAHRNTLLRELCQVGHKLVADDKSAPAIMGRHQRIVFLNKSEASSVDKSNVVPIEDLPDRVVKEFAQLTTGIMPSVALASIHAVRKGTHFLLAKFDRCLDGALAAHRALLSEPDDAASYAVDLVAEEVRSILTIGQEAQAAASIEQMEAWIDHESSGDTNRFTLPGSIQQAVSLTDVKTVLRDGLEQSGLAKTWGQMMEPKVSKEKVWHKLPDIYCGMANVGEANHAFSRLACLRREAAGEGFIPAGWLPMLTSGTILFEQAAVSAGPDVGSFFVCLQPRCDAIRMDEGRRFPLLPLKEVKPPQKFSMAVSLPNGRLVWLAPQLQPYRTEFPVFDPDPRKKVVLAVTATKPRHFYFKAKSNASDNAQQREFLWLGDLRPWVAQRIALGLAERVGRIGLDEYEWLRRNAE